MNVLQFGGFVFPHNPETLSLQGGRDAAVYTCPTLGQIGLPLEKRLRVVRCQGAFFGDTPSEAREWWRRLHLEKGWGRLVLPQGDSFWAVLENYQVLYSDDGCVLPYTLEFQEVEHESLNR